MGQLEDFTEKLGTAQEPVAADAKTIKRYQKKLPTALIELWQAEGWGAYADGLIWTVNPADFEDLLADWDVPKGAIVFARTAFADLVLWNKGKVDYLFTHHGRVEEMTDDLALYLNGALTSDDYLQKGLMGRVYKQVKKKLGRPTRDECYAFAPALSLGGSGKAETVRKVKLREQLGILAELVGT